MDRVSIVIPCYYNEGNIPELAKALIGNESLFDSNVDFEYILIDDDSGDRTWRKLLAFKADFPEKVTIIKLNRNVGSYNAIYPGLKRATGDCVVVMAADLQDPPSHIKTMYNEWKLGSKLVLANRENSTAGTLAYFNFLRVFGLPNLPLGGFDFCLFNQELKDELIQFVPEGANSLYHLLTLGVKPVLAPYVKQERKVGRSRWTTWKRIKLALNTIERYSKIRLVHLSLLFLSIGGVSLSSLSVFGSGGLLIIVLVLSMLATVCIEILRAGIRGTQQELTNVIEEVN